MKVMGCDCSSKSIACVVIGPEGLTETLVDSSAKDTSDRVLALYAGFKALLKQLKAKDRAPMAVFVEQAIFLQNPKTTLSIASVVSAVKFVAFDYGIPCFVVDNKTWKKDVVGSGSASKTDIMAFARLKWPEAAFEVQDLADAACISFYGQRRLGDKC